MQAMASRDTLHAASTRPAPGQEKVKTAQQDHITATTNIANITSQVGAVTLAKGWLQSVAQQEPLFWTTWDLKEVDRKIYPIYILDTIAQGVTEDNGSFTTWWSGALAMDHHAAPEVATEAILLQLSKVNNDIRACYCTLVKQQRA